MNQLKCNLYSTNNTEYIYIATRVIKIQIVYFNYKFTCCLIVWRCRAFKLSFCFKLIFLFYILMKPMKLVALSAGALFYFSTLLMIAVKLLVSEVLCFTVSKEKVLEFSVSFSESVSFFSSLFNVWVCYQVTFNLIICFSLGIC